MFRKILNCPICSSGEHKDSKNSNPGERGGLTVYAGGAFGVGFWLAFGSEMIPNL